MNEKLDLVEILKNCPKGTEFFSNIFGTLFFENINYTDHTDSQYPIRFTDKIGNIWKFTKDGKYPTDRFEDCDMCVFPSKDQRDWSKFKAPVEKFDYSTLQPFDKVLVRDSDNSFWKCNFLSQMFNHTAYCVGSYWDQMIPYNDETKHLLGTTDMPDEKYIWWEE